MFLFRIKSTCAAEVRRFCHLRFSRITNDIKRRDILPAFLLDTMSRHLPSPRYRRKKEVRRNRFGAGRKKKPYKKPLGRYGRKIVKGEASSRPCMPQSECGTGHTGYRAFLDPSPDGSQDIGGAFRSRVQRPGVRHRRLHIGRIWPCDRPDEARKCRPHGAFYPYSFRRLTQ